MPRRGDESSFENGQHLSGSYAEGTWELGLSNGCAGLIKLLCRRFRLRTRFGYLGVCKSPEISAQDNLGSNYWIYGLLIVINRSVVLLLGCFHHYID